MNESNVSSTLYFVYLANEIPSYGIASLLLAKQTSGCDVHLIGNNSVRKKVVSLDIGFTAVEEFYDSATFEKASSNITSDPDFRSGLWLKSTERLFVLQQFAEKFDLESLFHAELDQLVFKCNSLIDSLKNCGRKGVFLPFHSPDAVVASIIFINDFKVFDTLIEKALTGPKFDNEMQLLARWAAGNRQNVFALPTVATALKDQLEIVPPGIEILEVAEIGGVVDAAQLGQWVAGIDPRNVPISQTPKTLFVDPERKGLLNAKDLQSLNFTINSQSLTVEISNNRVKVFNLHLHSKSHGFIQKKYSNLSSLLNDANKNRATRISGMRYVQLNYYVNKIVKIIQGDPRRIPREIKWRFKARLKLRPSSAPFISGDTFRSVSDYRWEKNSKSAHSSHLKAGDIIFCESELLEELAEKVLNPSTVPLIVILANSDQNHTNSYIKKIYRRNNIQYFAQNLVEDIPNFHVLPIGIENAWRSHHGLIRQREAEGSSTEGRINRIMWGFTAATNPTVRNKAITDLERCSFADRILNVHSKEHQSLLKKYAFVASPPGNGIDTHRMWEALYFKSIPIVLPSYMNFHYQSIGLPIWIVDSYEELAEISEGELREKYDSLKAGFSNQSIWAKYWINDIQSISKLLRMQNG
jgi:hypothetical protein